VYVLGRPGNDNRNLGLIFSLLDRKYLSAARVSRLAGMRHPRCTMNGASRDRRCEVSEIRVLLNREHPSYERIAGAIRKNLQDLETAEVKELTEPQEPGTLAVDWPLVTGFVIQHGGDVLNLATAVLEMVTAIILVRGAAKPSTPKNEKPVIIMGAAQELVLPASSQKKKEFLAHVAGEGKATTDEKAQPKGKQSASGARVERASKRRHKK